MELHELQMCVHDIMNELHNIYLDFYIAWTQAQSGEIDAVHFLIRTDNIRINLNELTEEYFNSELSNEELYFQFKHFLDVWLQTVQIICARNAEWHAHYETLFKGIGLKALVLKNAFNRESEWIERRIARQNINP